MAAAKKTTTSKPARKPAKRAARAPKPAAAPPRAPTVAEILWPHFDLIIADYVNGRSLLASLEARVPELSTLAARQAIRSNPDMLARWQAVREDRGHFMFEEACTAAVDLKRTGFNNEAGKLFLQLAAKTLPEQYGDKSTVALTGADGGAVKSEVTMTPADAYRHMIGRP